MIAGSETNLVEGVPIVDLTVRTALSSEERTVFSCRKVGDYRRQIGNMVRI